MHHDPRGEEIRIHIDRSQPLPDPTHYLHPPCFDADDNPVYFGSAVLGDVVQPCKVTLKVDALVCVVAHRLVERVHSGPFTILPFTDAMHLVPTSHGRIPAGHRPVRGGVDESGRPLYHAVAWVRGERIPGQTSAHLGAAAVLVDGREHYLYDAHEILCWRNDDIEPLTGVGDPREEILPDVVEQTPETPVGSGPSGQPRPGEFDPGGNGLRVTVSDLSTVAPFPAAQDFDGVTSLYFGSAVVDNAILPGKVVAMHTCQVLQDDAVVERTTGFSILPFRNDMELVPTSHGTIPQGRRPVEGNHDNQGRKLYHAMLYVVGRMFPGMCAEHLGRAEGILQGRKYTLEAGYTILCWKEEHTDPSVTPSADPLQDFSCTDDPAGQRFRIPLNGDEELTTAMSQNFGESPIRHGGPWFFASALHDGRVTPCWARLSAQPCIYVHPRDDVRTCTGLYSVLPFLHDRMELVDVRNGVIPAGRTPVEGGRDEDGRPLYHAIGLTADGGPMMGFAAEHLRCAVIVCQVPGVHLLENYQLLCWRT